MKKLILLLSIIVLSIAVLASCGDESAIGENGKTNVRVAVLNGTTGFGMAQLMEQSTTDNVSNNYTFSVEQDPQLIASQLINGDVDIAAVPTNLASVLYNRTKGGIKVIALNTLGVLYVVETGDTVKSIADLEGKTIYTPAQNPSYILQYILKKNNINAVVDDYSYSQPEALRAAVVAGELSSNAIAVLPEPMVTIASNNNKSLRVALDLTAEWNKVESSPLVQGCVVVRNEFLKYNKDAVESFLGEYKASLEFVNTNTDEAASLIVKHGIFANEAVAKKAIPNCNIAYIDGSNMKNYLNGFLLALQSINAASIGTNMPTDDFYFIK